VTDPRAASLNDARLKIQWAEKRLQELRREVVEFTNAEMEKADIKLNPSPGVPFYFGRPDSPIPPSIPLLCGEIVQHLRSTLDYLVYELALLDSAEIQTGTQFPIEDSEDTFWKRRRRTWLEHVSDDHVSGIEQVQPYRGVVWSRVLRDLSNEDKHKTIVVFTHNTGLEATIEKAVDEGGRMEGLKIKAQFQTYVCFPDGEDVVATLATLKNGVGDLIDAFDAEF